MGQKVNPQGLRLNITRTWDSIWYADKEYSTYLIEDQKVKKFLKKRLQHAGLSKVNIERTGEQVRVKLFTARPGIVIGKKGAEIEILKKELENLIPERFLLIFRRFEDLRLMLNLLLKILLQQLVRRVAFRRAMKKAVSSALRFGVQGIKISCSGRLVELRCHDVNGFVKAECPLHTLRADVDYALAEATPPMVSLASKSGFSTVKF